jgi:hypothetical protein
MTLVGTSDGTSDELSAIKVTCCLCCIAQVWALAVLIIDDLPVHMSPEDHEVWRFFYRRCGMTHSEFSQVQQ